MLKWLRIKFVVINMTIVTLMLGIIFGLVYHFTQLNLETQSLKMMQAIVESPLRPETPEKPPEEIRLPYFMLQVGEHGDMTATGGSYYDLSNGAFLRRLVDASSLSHECTGVIEDYHLRYYRTVTPTAQYLVFADMSSEVSTLNSLLKTCVLIGSISFFVFLGVSLLLARWAVKPVDLAWRRQRQFVADASHELKMPLTVIMTNAQMLRSPEYSAENRARFSDGILTMATQMYRLVERLLALARAEGDQKPAVCARFDFSAAVEHALLTFEPVFYEKGLELSGHIQPDIAVNGDKEQLCQVIDALLDNAQKYSREGCTVVRLEMSDRHRCRFSVSNPGETIAEEDLKNIFKRFYRLDQARCRDGGFGLGLSIAQSIVLRHRGKIWAESGSGVNTFLIKLPAAR